MRGGDRSFQLRQLLASSMPPAMRPCTELQPDMLRSAVSPLSIDRPATSQPLQAQRRSRSHSLCGRRAINRDTPRVPMLRRAVMDQHPIGRGNPGSVGIQGRVYCAGSGSRAHTARAANLERAASFTLRPAPPTARCTGLVGPGPDARGPLNAVPVAAQTRALWLGDTGS